MIVKEDFLSKLRHYFSLNLYEVRIWAALLSRGVSTAGELSDIGNVPRSRTYDVLESLEKKSFIVMKLGKPIRYLAVDPREVLERVKKNLRKDAEEGVTKLEELKATNIMDELNLLHKQGVEYIESSDLSGALRGRKNIYTHLETMVKNAQSSIVLVTTSKGLLRKMEALRPEFERLVKKGVSIKIAAPIDKDNVVLLRKIPNGVELRHLKDLDARFCVIDAKEILFMVLNDDEVHPAYDMGIWINTPYFAKTLQSMFDKTWTKLEPAEKIASKIK